MIKPPDLVPLDETFRRILRASSARQKLADEITGYDWFHKRQDERLKESGFKYNSEEYEAAKSSLERLKRGIKGQQIRLRGRLNSRVEDIDPIDAAKGEIDVFDNTLEIGKQTYTDVYCITLQTISRPRQKFDRAGKIAQAIWGSGGPPSHLSNNLICKEVADRLRKDGQRDDINDATILRAVGRKK